MQRATKTDLLSLCGVPPRVRNAIREDDFSDMWSASLANQSVYLWGPTGSGKTITAVRLMIASMIKSGVEFPTDSRSISDLFAGPLPDFAKQFKFVSLPHMLESLRRQFRPRAIRRVITLDSDEEEDISLSEQIQMAHYVILDDLGVESMSDWAYGVLYRIVDYRYNWLLPTVFTSSCSLHDLAAKWPDDRLLFRIYEMCKQNIIHLRGVSVLSRLRGEESDSD